MKKSRVPRILVLFVLIALLIAVIVFLAFTFLGRPKAPPAQLPQTPPFTMPNGEPPAPVPTPAPQPLPKKEPEKPKEPLKPPVKAAESEELGPGKVRLCPNSKEAAAIASDGRLFGHHPYANASPSDLGSPPSGFNSGNCSSLHGEAKVALEKMIEGARASDPTIADAMIGLSCFRSAAYQKEVFCRKVGDGFAVRARASAPPGYSEHATGYAIDFGDRTNPGCNLSACFATTPVGQWLAANAGQYGFVLSFPKGNGQGVMYEPWHWRYQGSGASQGVFAGAN